MESPSLITILISGLLGAIVAAILNIVFSNIREKNSRSLRLIDDFNSRTESIGHVIYFLNNPDTYKGDSALHHKKYNDIKSFCMWFSVFSYLYVEYKLNRKVIDRAGLNKEIIRFYELIKESEFEVENQKKEWIYLGKMKELQVNQGFSNGWFFSKFKYLFL